MASPDPGKSAETDVPTDILDPDASVSFRDSVCLRIAVANDCSDPRAPPLPAENTTHWTTEWRLLLLAGTPWRPTWKAGAWAGQEGFSTVKPECGKAGVRQQSGGEGPQKLWLVSTGNLLR